MKTEFVRNEIYYKIEVQDGGRWSHYQDSEYEDKTVARQELAAARDFYKGYLFRLMKYTVTIDEDIE